MTLTDSFDLYSYFYGLVRQIPEGMVSTYGDLARALGDQVAARACGYMLSINPDPEGTPCYRVVLSDGEVGKYTHLLGTAEKVRRLQNDGLSVINGKIDDFEKRRFRDFRTDFPLAKLRKEQELLASQISLVDDFQDGPVAAIDVSYDDFEGYGIMALSNRSDIEITETVQKINFPYIPGYLAYREFQFIDALAKGFEGILLIDASGYLHPRHIGLASYAGLKLNIPTIGVAKSLLTGEVKGDWVLQAGEKAAFILSKSAIISAGYRISLDSAVKFVKNLNGEKYPEILKIAHDNTVRLRQERRRLSS